MDESIEINPIILISGDYNAFATGFNGMGIYAISGLAPSSFELPIYVGSAKNLRDRIYNKHINSLLRDNNANQPLQNYFNSNGIENLVFFCLESCGEKELLETEQKYIDYYGTVQDYKAFNIAPTAGNTLGFQHSEESKRAMSEKHTGKFVGEETRKRQSAARKGRKVSDETKKRMSKSQKGLKKPYLSKRNKEKLSKEYKFLSPDGKLVVGKNLRQFCRENNLCQANMQGVLKGRVKSCKGWSNPDFAHKWKKHGKEYKFLSPEGKIYEGKNIKKFMRDMGLSMGFLNLCSGNIKEFQGWTKIL